MPTKYNQEKEELNFYYLSEAKELGEPIPNTKHAVFCSLPTIEDIIGYEEADKKVLAKMQLGYPRFFNHPLAQQLETYIAKDFLDAPSGVCVRLIAHKDYFFPLLKFIGAIENADSLCLHENGDWGLVYISFIYNPSLASRIQLFLQNTGAMLFSRQIEDLSYALSLIQSKQIEESLEIDQAELYVRKNLAFWNCGSEDLHKNVFLTNCGANAVYSVYQTLCELHKKRYGQHTNTKWVQLGWLYLDTMELLEKHDSRQNQRYLIDSQNYLQDIENYLKRHGNEIAGVFTELPTNPLLQSCDLEKLYQICRKHNIPLVVDPTLSSAYNVDVLPHCDILVSSLTKYYANRGDVMMGTVIFNQSSPFDNLQKEVFQKFHVALPYGRDIKRLALELQDYEEVMEKMNKNTLVVADYLERHKKVKEVHWAYQKKHKNSYQNVQKPKGGPGAVISFVLNEDLQKFYNKVIFPKGPSFGYKYSVLCPFIYLAHYDLISSDEGNKFLMSQGLSPQLLRFSCGVENPDDIIRNFEEGFCTN